LRDPGKVSLIKKRLWDAGIEASDLYAQPLHHKFDLGYKTQEFPNACYLAKGLLTLPVYPEVKIHYLLKISEVIKKDAI
jgi:dTDP-4-amino-4,6-dideoxygalactose transaminase